MRVVFVLEEKHTQSCPDRFAFAKVWLVHFVKQSNSLETVPWSFSCLGTSAGIKWLKTPSVQQYDTAQSSYSFCVYSFLQPSSVICQLMALVSVCCGKAVVQRGDPGAVILWALSACCSLWDCSGQSMWHGCLGRWRCLLPPHFLCRACSPLIASVDTFCNGLMVVNAVSILCAAHWGS